MTYQIRISRHIDLIAIAGTALCAWLIGNQVGTFGVYSAGHPDLGPGAALFFLSHNNLQHAQQNMLACGGYLLIILTFRLRFGLIGDPVFIISALLTSHLVTLVSYIWLMPPSVVGSHGFSVITSTLLGLVITFATGCIAHRRDPENAVSLTAIAAAMAGAAYFAVSGHRHGFDFDQLDGPLRGEIGHAIGIGTGLIFGTAHAIWYRRSHSTAALTSSGQEETIG